MVLLAHLISPAMRSNTQSTTGEPLSYSSFATLTRFRFLIVGVKLTSGFQISAYLPVVTHNGQEHCVVLVGGMNRQGLARCEISHCSRNPSYVVRVMDRRDSHVPDVDLFVFFFFAMYLTGIYL